MNQTTDLAKKIRINVLNMTSQGSSSHIGSIFSMADLLAVLYGEILNVKPDNPKWEDRDRFILSKGHAGAGVYAALAELGFFLREKLATHYQNGSDLSGHVSHKGVPGVEISTGSLGHGLPIAAGMAYAGKIGDKNHRVFVLLGDGECDEGSNWEAILFAHHHRLDNLIAIVDYNKLQSLTTIAETLALEPFADKWRSFGWEVIEINGHDLQAISQACHNLPIAPGKPTCIIAHTVKGKGVSFMENSVLWHYRSAKDEEYDRALQELEAV